jgi:hypothetical protein
MSRTARMDTTERRMLPEVNRSRVVSPPAWIHCELLPVCARSLTSSLGSPRGPSDRAWLQLSKMPAYEAATPCAGSGAGRVPRRVPP